MIRTLLASAALAFIAVAASPAIAQVQAPCRPHVTPSEERIYDRVMRHFETLALSPQQQSQIQALIHQYSLAHPAGSPFDYLANRELHEQIRGILTPQQLQMLAQLHAERRAGGGEHPRCHQ
jgi:Spy/CpxP family protein refolding chaperone